MTDIQVQQIIDQIQSGLNSISDSLGVALPHIWEVLVRQQYVIAMKSLVFFVIWLIPVFFVKKYYIYAMKKYNANNYDDMPIAGFYAFIIILFAIGLFVITDLVGGMGRVINPEYYVIQDISDLVTSKL